MIAWVLQFTHDLFLGCMESLVHYKRLLIRNHASAADSSALTRECISLLKKLREVDPGRRARYDEIGTQLVF